jgi:hypothetical protein
MCFKYKLLECKIKKPILATNNPKCTTTRKNVVFTWASFAAPADEVRAEHVKLSWEAPEDDGGTPIIKYIVRLLDLDYNEWINVCEVCTL